MLTLGFQSSHYSCLCYFGLVRRHIEILLTKSLWLIQSGTPFFYTGVLWAALHFRLIIFPFVSVVLYEWDLRTRWMIMDLMQHPNDKLQYDLSYFLGYTFAPYNCLSNNQLLWLVYLQLVQTGANNKWNLLREVSWSFVQTFCVLRLWLNGICIFPWFKKDVWLATHCLCGFVLFNRS